MGAAQHKGVRPGGKHRGKPCSKAALQCGTGQLTALDELHQLRTGAFQNMAVLGAALQQGGKFLLAERGLRGQHADAAAGMARNGQLERRLNADDDPIRPAGAQRTDGGGCRRVAGHDKGLCAPVKQALGMGERQRTNFCGRARAIGRVGRVAEVEKMLARHLRDQLPQDAQSADTGIKYGNGAHTTASFPTVQFLIIHLFGPKSKFRAGKMQRCGEPSQNRA